MKKGHLIKQDHAIKKYNQKRLLLKKMNLQKQSSVFLVGVTRLELATS